jgi:hypothetical protein
MGSVEIRSASKTIGNNIEQRLSADKQASTSDITPTPSNKMCRLGAARLSGLPRNAPNIISLAP